MSKHEMLVTAVREALKQTSMRKLAANAGVSHTTISALLSGKSADVSLNTYQRLMKATESNMRKPVTTHDHAAATFEQVEQAAADRGLNADIGQRDTELECAKYKRVMALEAELDAWKGQLRAAKVQIDELKTDLECSRIDVRKAETLAQVAAKDLQTMTASWKTVSVERDTLQRDLNDANTAYLSSKSQHAVTAQQLADAREQVKCLQDHVWQKTEMTNDLTAQVEKNGDWIRYLDQRIDDLTVERDDLLTQQMQIDTEHTRLQKDAHYARSIAWACGVALLLLVVLMVATAAKGGVL
jgi:transcriptional regulator with XRE-family HTH domain